MSDRRFVLLVLAALVGGLLLFWFTVWFITTCTESHGGQWWCWLG